MNRHDSYFSELSVRPRWKIFNVWVHDFDMDELVLNLEVHGGVVFTLNPDHVFHLHHLPEFRAAYSEADIVTMDSTYLFAAMRLRGMKIRNRLCGSDIVPAYLDYCAANNKGGIFLLGGMPGVAEKAASKINEASGKQLVIGAHGPSMNFVNDQVEVDKVIAMINQSKATTLFVALGAPKQEIWITQNREKLPYVKVFVGVGATVDYQAGVVKRAPEWMRSLYMEWAYRVITEPRRYFMRYVRNSRVFWWVLLEHFGSYQNKDN